MTTRDRKRHGREAASYMRTCSNSQLDGVIEAETDRLSRCSKGDVASVAKIMIRAAIHEKKARGQW